MAAPNLKYPNIITGRSARGALTTSLTTALINPAGSGKVLKINSCYCANIDGINASDVDLALYNGVTDFYLAKTVAVPADATQLLITREAYIYLEEGDSLRAKASAADDLHLVIGYEEIS